MQALGGFAQWKRAELTASRAHARVLSPFAVVLTTPLPPLPAQPPVQVIFLRAADSDSDPAVTRERGSPAGEASSLRQARLRARGSWITVLALAYPDSGVSPR